MIKEARWSGWVWVGECLFWYRPTRVVPDQRPLNGRFCCCTQVNRYQKGKTNLDFTEARDSEWQWHQLGHMQVCTLLHTENHASTPPLGFLQARCPSCHQANSVKVLKAKYYCLSRSVLLYCSCLLLYWLCRVHSYLLMLKVLCQKLLHCQCNSALWTSNSIVPCWACLLTCRAT